MDKKNATPGQRIEGITFKVLVVDKFYGRVHELGMKEGNDSPTMVGMYSATKYRNRIFHTADEAEAFKMLHITKAFRLSTCNWNNFGNLSNELGEFNVEFDGDIKTYLYSVISSDGVVVNTGELNIKIYSSIFPTEVSYRQTIPRSAPVGK